MKILLFLLFVATASAQTITTNYLTAAANFREVDGRLYNIDKSTNWQEIKVRITDRANEISSAVILKPHYKTGYNRVPEGNALLGGGGFYRVFDGEIEDSEIQIRNCPLAISATSKVKIIKVGISTNGYELWDFGKPHVVQVLKTNFTQISSVKN